MKQITDLSNYSKCSILTIMNRIIGLNSISVYAYDDKLDTWIFFEQYFFLPNQSTLNIYPTDTIITQGNICDYNYILNMIINIDSICKVIRVQVDQYNCTQFINDIQAAGFRIKSFYL